VRALVIRRLATFAVFFTMLLALLGGRAFADDPLPQSQEPAVTPTALLPNTPVPDDQRQGVASAAPHENLLPDAFVTAGSPAEEQAVYAALESFLRHQGEAGQVAPADIWPQAIPAVAAPVYLPLVRHRVDTQVNPPIETPTATPDDRKPADVAVALWAEPSIRVSRAGTLTYEIRVRNYGSGAALRTEVELPFDRAQITPVGSQLDQSSGDWVSKLADKSLTVTFGEVGAGEERSGRIIFRVAGGLADNLVIPTRATFRWVDERRSSAGTTNWAPVLVGGSNDNAAYVWLIVEPAVAGRDTTRGFYSDRFMPDEGVTTWLNMPGAQVRPLEVRGKANGVGQVWLSYKPSDLAPGTYQLVVYGNRSKLTGVVSFVVR
jgi:hypothetical protein